ncbi:MAG: dipeptidase [Bacteroidales bacterium]|jgi:membrane dipeptidase|nr:dipeptidase [Bacteroidales bacterium]MBQ1882937.1 dipeptidase [Bacteroidales bacterium]MBQ2482568.1 dipeptidase [Bacteroidales bacterium]MBQ2492029.1 dipeptidase [Bacteroidales bacterium]MBQ4197945.1 dipeptidase [Bacteroidales bacterium]
MAKSVHQLHMEAMVVDTHCDTPLRIDEEHADLGVRSNEGHNDFIRMKEGGIDLMFYAIFTRTRLTPDQSTVQAVRLIGETKDMIAANRDKVALAYSVRHARQIKQSGRGAIMLGMENGSPVQNDLALLHEFYRMGVRYITLCHSAHNQLCDSCAPKQAQWHGLSPMGKKVVTEMNRLGMIVDVSHLSDESFYDCLKYSKAPIVATHSCCRALCKHPRNMTDQMIKDLAKAGGVIQINFYPAFLSDEYGCDAYFDAADNYDAAMKAYWRSGKKGKKEIAEFKKQTAFIKKNFPSPSYKLLVDHIEHVIDLVGIDYVGLGSDYDGIEMPPVGLEDVSKFEVITRELRHRGYSDEDIKKVLGENFLRAFTQVEDCALTF